MAETTTQIEQIPGLWLADAAGEPPAVRALREGLLQRVDKADGHINAAERKLWHETERGLWSARQAQARIAEVWMGLSGALSGFAPIERYLDKRVMRARLQAFAATDLPASMHAAYREVLAAEAAIQAEPFVDLSGSGADPQQREALQAGLARKYRYLDALRALRRAVEACLAERFVALKPGDWIRLKDPMLSNHLLLAGYTDFAATARAQGLPGEVIALRGLTAWVFFPGVAERRLEEAIHGYRLGSAGLERAAPPPPGPITAPGYYWLTAARRRFARSRALLRGADGARFSVV